MSQTAKTPLKDKAHDGASPTGKAAKGQLAIRQAVERDIPYIMDLARREIGSSPRRLSDHKTFLILLANKPAGFISYRRETKNHLYLYMLALEKEAQNQGHARTVVRWVINKENAAAPVAGIRVKVLKTNAAALHVTQEKYGYTVVEELKRYFILTRPVQ
jgi:ribosomal protein S18 acetylase RimI-like enzyme